MRAKLLLITDYADLANLQAQRFVQYGFDVSVVRETVATNMISAANLENYDLILLYLLDGKVDSLELCRSLSAIYDNPILFFTFERDERVTLRVYEAGAAECIIQPMRFDLLVAKVRAWLRYTGSRDKTVGVLEAYGFRFDQSNGEVVTPQETLVRLSPLEARLLHILIANSGRIVLKERIVRQVWPDDAMVDKASDRLQTLVHRLRRKLEPQYIQATRNQGYTFGPSTYDSSPM